LNVIEFPRGGKWCPLGWTPEEATLIDRVVNQVSEAGWSSEAVHGMTERGDPWLALMPLNDGDYLACISKVGTTFAVHASGGVTVIAEGQCLAQVLIQAFPSAFRTPLQEVSHGGA
jgi:hypothetical protein